MRRRRPSDETLVTLRGKLEDLAPRSAERQRLLQGCADLHGVSVATVYRALREQFRPRSLHRRDRGRPRKLSEREMERFCELVAAMKLRTTNGKNRHLSTVRAIELLVEHGIETPDGLVRAPPGLLTRTTVNRYLRAWGLDDERMSRPPPAQRFQAEYVNECWQFDLSPSDLKQVPAPFWVEAGRGQPTLMLFSAVDDRSGVVYQEYRCVYGEDVAAALRFLFNAMSPKDEPGLVLQGIPGMLYLDNGPVAKSGVFRRVMAQLGVEVRTHMPRGSDGRRVTARSKGKVERPFRTVKEAHETLYHFHTPRDEAEANLWLRHYLARYNAQPHRSGRHSRAEDWGANLPEAGIRAMCAWERFCAFAREPERRRVGIDARVQVDGISYEVESSLAGETVTLWWGCSTTSCSSSMPTSGSGRSDPSTGRSRCTATAASASPRRMAASTASRCWRASSACRARRWTGRRRSRPRPPSPRRPCRSTTLTRSASCISPACSRPSLRLRTTLAVLWRSWRPRISEPSTRFSGGRWSGAR